MSITAHCLVKNEENFVGYAIRSVINYVDKIIVFDTGSTDQTVEIINKIQKEFPGKILFEEKGKCDKKRHTELRQEMIDKTSTEWFMILDGDEVWTDRALEEALEIIKANSGAECVLVPFYLCVGDIFHQTVRKGGIELFDWQGFFYPRFFKKIRGIKWAGDFNNDTNVDEENKLFFKKNTCYLIKNKYWHLTHLQRSSKDLDDYSSFGSRGVKRRSTYFLIGKKIRDKMPEVFLLDQNNYRLSFLKSVQNFFKLMLIKKII